MNISNRHQRVVAATPERIARLIAEFDSVWPTQLAPAPRPMERRLYDTGSMVWEEFARPGAVRAFRVIRPAGLQAEHWFEVVAVHSGTLLRHTVEGEALGPYTTLWRERIEPLHDRVLEALFDNVEAALSAAG